MKRIFKMMKTNVLKYGKLKILITLIVFLVLFCLILNIYNLYTR